MFCTNCGNKLEDGALFCTSCGTKIGDNNVNQVVMNPPKKKSKIIPIIILVIVFILVIGYIGNESLPANPAVGTWDCKSFYGTLENEDTKYIVTMKLDNNNTFLWGKYGDTQDNHAIGFYTFEDLEKTNNSGNYSYYSIELTADEFVDEGVLQSEDYISKYEIGINDEAGEAILMNVDTYNMYYCYRSSSDDPTITRSY